MFEPLKLLAGRPIPVANMSNAAPNEVGGRREDLPLKSLEPHRPFEQPASIHFT